MSPGPWHGDRAKSKDSVPVRRDYGPEQPNACACTTRFRALGRCLCVKNSLVWRYIGPILSSPGGISSEDQVATWGRHAIDVAGWREDDWTRRGTVDYNIHVVTYSASGTCRSRRQRHRTSLDPNINHSLTTTCANGDDIVKGLDSFAIEISLLIVFKPLHRQHLDASHTTIATHDSEPTISKNLDHCTFHISIPSRCPTSKLLYITQDGGTC